MQAFAEDPLVPRGLRRLTETANTLEPTLAFVAPAQTTCNYIALFFRNIASLLSEGDRNGTWQRFIIVATPLGPNNEGTSPSRAGRTGRAPPTTSTPTRTRTPRRPASRASARRATSRTWRGRTVTSNPPGRQQAATEGKP